ncbi:CDT1-like protein a, chloroplastic [Primulina huaijiensis]|uniref:CDT1-like protein a, chloroplastic n=1 Tax=Primulina huaijiensis TaxID=1492673 RepID=UPI003CC71809
MESAKSSLLNVCKSKKPLHSSSGPRNRKISGSDSNPWTVKTPGKTADPPRRMRHPSAAMSIKEIREAALKLRESGSGQSTNPGPVVGSTNEHFDTWSESAATVKQKKKPADGEIKLPEKYELLDNFFNSLDSSLRLLQLKRSATLFTNVRPQVETLTDRRFTHSHLAQLKFIMPDVIEIEKVLRRDERTCCVKPDLRISLNVKAIGDGSNAKSDSRNVQQLRKVFRARLVEFYKSHLVGDDVPEDELPEPFNRLKEDYSRNLVCASASSPTIETPDVGLLLGDSSKASHMSLSFRRSFSRGSMHTAENLRQEKSVIDVHVLVDSEPKSVQSFSENASSPFSVDFPSESSSNEAASAHVPPSILLDTHTPVKSVNLAKNEDGSCTLGTPVELCSTPAQLICSTPMLQPPKRCCRSPNEESSGAMSKLVRRPPPNRPLKFDTPVKIANANNKLSRSTCGNLSASGEIFDILPEALLQSIQEKEKKALMERDPAISQAKWRLQMIAGLPKLFNMIYFLFQSIRRSVLTKEELIQKIIAGNMDVVDRREVEEQLRLLQELAPEWIHEKSASSGDLLVCINKISSPESIRARLAEAK